MVLNALFVALRAAFVFVLVLVPSFIIPGLGKDDIQLITLVALSLAGLVAWDYTGSTPAVIEFRDAPPYNRLRGGVVMIAMVILSMIATPYDMSPIIQGARAVGLFVAHALDGALSPVALFTSALPDAVPDTVLTTITAMIGVSFTIALIGLAAFGVMVRLRKWPTQQDGFNLWLNLPIFGADMAGDHIDKRITRQAQISVALGGVVFLTLPMIWFKILYPGLGQGGMLPFHALVWAVMAWVFIPFGLFMRAIALRYVSDLMRATPASIGGSCPDKGNKPADMFQDATNMNRSTG
jgi:hypothetical protein